MKTLNFLQIVIVGLTLVGCGQNATKNDTSSMQGVSQNQRLEKPEKTSSDHYENKFLITNDSVGYFKINSSWHKIANDIYNYKYVQSYGICIDACCDGGYLLGNNLVDSDYGDNIENPELTIGAMIFDQNESENEHINNPNVFFASSDNCRGWYWKDKISYIMIQSDLFKTKEGIGVGTNLEKLEDEFGKLHFTVGWIEEDANAVQVEIDSYSSIQFILDVDDYDGNWEEISLTEENNTLTTSQFKKNAKIKRIIITTSDD